MYFPSTPSGVLLGSRNTFPSFVTQSVCCSQELKSGAAPVERKLEPYSAAKSYSGSHFPADIKCVIDMLGTPLKPFRHVSSSSMSFRLE